MEYGFILPTRGPLATPENLAAQAKRGEELGFDFLTVPDHVIIPADIDSRYPYSETGEFPGGADVGECLEQLTLLSFLVGLTSRIRLLTSVIVLPHRGPVYTAKALASIDVLSKGRLGVGCGVGWMREEFEAIGTPPYEERGAVGSEYIRAFKELWTSDNPTFEGNYCSFSNVTFSPKPVQKPHPPIWVGGESPPALRRAGQLGDAWYPIIANPVFPLDSTERFSESLAKVRRHAEEAGRDPAEVDVALSTGPWYDERQAHTGRDGKRRIFSGAAEQIADDVGAFARLGAQHFMFNFGAASLSETTDRMELFASRIKPLVG